MGEKRKISVKSRIIGIMLLCWFLPFILIVGINIYYIYSSQFDSKVSKQIQQLKFYDQTSAERLNKVIKASRQASYDGKLIEGWTLYEKDAIQEQKLLQSSTYYLTTQYRHDEGVRAAVLWYYDAPEKLRCSTYNESAGGNYHHIAKYWENDHKGVAALAGNLDTAVGLYMEDSRLYVVRNIVDPSYNKAAVLVMLVNKDYCFENYQAFPENTSVTLSLKGHPLKILGETVNEDETGLNQSDGSAGYRWENGRLALFHRMSEEEYDMLTLVRFDDSSVLTLFYGYRAVIAGMLLFLIPLLLILMYVFRRHITAPMERMMTGAAQIEQGNLGYQLDYEPESTEFQYLADSFNAMSGKLKYQFDHIYAEELALKDAKIMALQSHINPHFMNNTLEIINWEARLSGNQKVSKMIEALSTLMDAGIDRKKQPVVLLSEEMIYVNAYLYITSERLGKRLDIIKNLPDEIMQYKVPRLILQPVIENAIEHGVVRKGQGTVEITGRKEGDYLYLETVNESVMSKSEKERVERLLDQNYDTCSEPRGNLGIANVNQRLKILYGDTCGLTIEQSDENHVLTRLTILAEEENKIKQ